MTRSWGRCVLYGTHVAHKETRKSRGQLRNGELDQQQLPTLIRAHQVFPMQQERLLQ